MVRIKPHPRLYNNYMLICTNGVVKIERNSPFRLLVANVSNIPKRVVRNQTIEMVLPYPRLVVTTQVSTAEVLGIVMDEEKSPNHETNLIEKTGSYNSWNAGTTPTAAKLGSSHVPNAYREPLKKMLLKYYDMWEGCLGYIKVVKHGIDLNDSANTVMQRPYRTGPASRQFVSEEVDQMLDKGIIKPGQ